MIFISLERLMRNIMWCALQKMCLHAGYTTKNTEPRVVPIVQSTTYVYDFTNEVAAVLLSLLNICEAGDSFI